VKILFLAGSLEPGKDGVGDYTRTLATECARLGHETFLLSFYDPWINGSMREPAALRLGTMMPSSDRVKAAREFLTANRAEIVSLQFVSYSFHPAGLNVALPQILRVIIGQTRVQVMFHELWIGTQIGAPVQVKALGLCQRKIIQAMVKALAYRIVHTSCSVHVQLLARYGIDAKLLPLFGNVPVVSADSSLARADNVLHLGMFGDLGEPWAARDFEASGIHRAAE